MVTPIIISYSQSKIFKDYVLKILFNFYQAVFPENNFLENRPVHKKGGFLGYLPFNIYPFHSEL